MPSQRPVSPFESVYFVDLGSAGLPLYGIPAFFESVVRGRLDASLIRRALFLLAEHHPALRAEAVAGEAGPVLRVRDSVQPPLTVLEGLDESFAEVINSRPDWSEGMLYAWLLTGGEHSQVVLGVHHGVSDARSGFALLHEFWRYYTALAAGADPAPRRRDALPEAVDTRLAADFPEYEIDALADALAEGGGADAEDAEPVTLPADGAGRPGGTPGAHRFVLHRQEFDTHVTDALAGAARARGMTVNSIVSGLLMTAVREQLQPGDGPLPLVCGHAVDLRPRLTPELPRDVVVNCITGFQTPLTVTHGDDPTAVGRAVSGQVSTALARRDPERFLLAALRAGARGVAVPVPVVTHGISNVGRIPAHPVPDDVRLVRFGATVNAPGLPPKLFVASLDGRLLVQHEYDSRTHGAERMRRLRETLRASLEALVR
ncbi:phthiocerol/phthiodiolone dimycocerosyl transferase family protein [Streptomyces sp. NPDC003719]